MGLGERYSTYCVVAGLCGSTESTSLIAGFLSGHLTGNDRTIPKSFFFQNHLFLFGNVPVKCLEQNRPANFLKSTKSTPSTRIGKMLRSPICSCRLRYDAAVQIVKLGKEMMYNV